MRALGLCWASRGLARLVRVVGKHQKDGGTTTLADRLHETRLAQPQQELVQAAGSGGVQRGSRPMGDLTTTASAVDVPRLVGRLMIAI